MFTSNQRCSWKDMGDRGNKVLQIGKEKNVSNTQPLGYENPHHILFLLPPFCSIASPNWLHPKRKSSANNHIILFAQLHQSFVKIYVANRIVFIAVVSAGACPWSSVNLCFSKLPYFSICFCFSSIFFVACSFSFHCTVCHKHTLLGLMQLRVNVSTIIEQYQGIFLSVNFQIIQGF